MIASAVKRRNDERASTERAASEDQSHIDAKEAKSGENSRADSTAIATAGVGKSQAQSKLSSNISPLSTHAAATVVAAAAAAAIKSDANSLKMLSAYGDSGTDSD